MNEALVIARLIHFAAAMAVFGAAAFGLYAIDPGAELAQTHAAVRFDRWNIRLLRVGAAAMLASALIILPFVAARMAGTASAAVDAATIAIVLFETEFGRIWCGHLFFALLLIGGIALMPTRRALNLACAALALASLGLVGHAAAGSGWAGLGGELNQSIHLLAGGLWLGGLLPLGWLLGRSNDEPFDALTRYALPVFSRMGYLAVAAIAITGIVNSLALVGSIDALLRTDYGRLLSLKIILYLAMVATALHNRFLLSRRVADGDVRASRALYRSVLVEQALGLGTLAAVSLLGTWPPPFMHRH